MKNSLGQPIKTQLKKLSAYTTGMSVLFVVLQAGLLFALLSFLLPQSLWLIVALVVPALTVLFLMLVINTRTDETARQLAQELDEAVDHEIDMLRRENKRAHALRQMASTLRSSLNFDQVMEQALEVSGIALEELNVPAKTLVGAVFLYEGQELAPVATRRLLAIDEGQRILGKDGIVGEALLEAEMQITREPSKDPELNKFVAFRKCQTAVCIPLRAGFQIFGAMVLAVDQDIEFADDQTELFTAVADQTVIALQNAQLYQNLEREKQRLIKADEEARKELARDLHDGPTQSIAAIAMRVNFIRTMIRKNPDQALIELQKVEDLAKQTSKEIRGMLFTLRPLVLESQGLAKAIETVIHKLKEADNLNIQFVGKDNAQLLNENAQTVVFSIVEEALGNARKYSQANLIEVRMWREDNLFVVRVQDDGVGFDVQDVNRDYSSRGSLGMVNMRERAERIDGSLRLESAIGQGTTITLVVPLHKHGRH